MANEISYQFQMRLGNGTLTDAYNNSSGSASQTTAALVRNTQTISTAAGGDALDLGGVVTPGFAVFSNLDGTNYVEVGSNVAGTFYPFLKLNPGEQSGPVRLSVAAPYARANTGSVKLFYIIYSD